MSAPVMSRFYTSLEGLVSSQNTSGGGSGITNFISGLNLGGTSSGSISSLTSSLSLLGPVGALVGTVSNLIPGLDGFLNNGFDFTCLGSQAFASKDYNAFYAEDKSKYEAFQAGNLDVVAFLDWCFWRRVDSQMEIGRYRSGCSRSLRQKLFDFQNALYEGVDKSNITWKDGTRKDWKGETVPDRKHALKNALGSVPTELQGMTIERFNTEIVPAIKTLALQQNLNEEETIQKAYSKLFPNGGTWTAGGSASGSTADGIDWNVGVNAGNTQPNYGMYALIAGAGFLAYKMLIKK